jgi:hypothetical protein
MHVRNCKVVVAAAVLLVAGCVGDPPAQTKPQNKTLTLGELLYRVVRDNLTASSTCGPAYTARYTPHHDDLVASFDRMVTQGLSTGATDVLGKAMQPSVASGALPRLARRIGDALGLLVSDSFDPQRATLKALLSLGDVPTLFESTMLSQLASALLTQRDLAARFHALRLLAEENDGVTGVLDDALGLVLSPAGTSAPTCTGVTLDDVQGTVLRSAGFVEDPAYKLGAAAWMVRPDKHGNPRVLVDVKTGKLAAPFVDHDGDGAADVDAHGHPIDASGNVIDRPFLGAGGLRDPLGRALNDSGGLLYDYYDVKRTALSYAVQMVIDALAAGVHHDLPPLVDAVLGQPATCSDGTPTCRNYPGADHPLADLVHLALETLRVPKATQLLSVLNLALTNDPGKAEDFLIALGDIVNAFHASSLALTDTNLQAAVADLIPLLRAIFTVENSDGQSTARLLVDLIGNMTTAEKAGISTSLGWMIEYQSLVDRPDPTPDGVSVDYGAPRFVGSTDNRSGLERTIELVDYANCGSLAGNSVAYTIINLAADLSPSTVSSLIDLALGGLGVTGSFGEVLIRAALTAFGCDYARTGLIYDHIMAVNVLAKSGGLDWLLPVARVFKERGQVQTLVDIFGYVAGDLRLDEDGDAATVSSVRRLEPVFLTALKAGALTKLFLEVDVLGGIQVPGSTDRASHLVMDTIEYVVQEGPVHLRNGKTVTSSLAVEILRALGRVSARVGTQGAAYDALERMLDFARQYLASTTSGSKRVLVHPNLRLLLAVGLQAAADLADVPAASYGCLIDGWEQQANQFLTGRDFATLVRLGKQLATSPNARGLESWVVALLRGDPTTPAADSYGPILQLVASAASADVAGDDLDQLLKWLKAVAADNRDQALELVTTLDDLLTQDRDGSMLQIARNAVAPGTIASGESPMQVYADVFSDVSRVDGENACMVGGAVTLARLEQAVGAVHDFLVDEKGGITTIWKLVGTPAPNDPGAP